ncbi:amidohydrolase family protein [Microbacterium karelineae]|uniref:amidohydrolase family protein n=1 Tax=Microbacterium karelineae TaxID=2654283 RepID=UPI001E310B98|nr:amidohydrolase [Microbacterium karelineae]
MNSIFISSAQVITMSEENGSTPITASIRIVEGAIQAIGSDLAPADGDTIIDGRDKLVAPGFVNAHSHSWETLFKGRYDNLPLELWMLFSYPIIGHARVDPDLIRLRTQLFAAESLKSGVTTVIDDVLETPSQDESQLDAVIDAYELVGIRANVSGHVINKPFVDTLPFVGEMLDGALLDRVRRIPVATADEYLEFSRRAFDRHRGRAGGRIRYMVAPSGPQRCTDDLIAGATELAVAEGAECHIHVLETKTQAVTGSEIYGSTLVEHLAAIGGLSPNTTFAHGIWVTDDDIRLIADAGVSVSHNPISNMKLGSGILPWRAYHDAGVNIGLGTDGLSSSDMPRMLEVIKAAALVHKVSGPDFTAWPTVEEVLRAGTIGGARSGMLQDATGSLEVGKRADLNIYDLESLAFTPRNDLDKQLVYSENGSSLEYVIVDGEIVVDHGTLTTVDEPALIAELAARRPQLQVWQRALERLNEAFVPSFTAMYEKAQAREVGFTRFIASR